MFAPWPQPQCPLPSRGWRGVFWYAPSTNCIAIPLVCRKGASQGSEASRCDFGQLGRPPMGGKHRTTSVRCARPQHHWVESEVRPSNTPTLAAGRRVPGRGAPSVANGRPCCGPRDRPVSVIRLRPLLIGHGWHEKACAPFPIHHRAQCDHRGIRSP